MSLTKIALRYLTTEEFRSYLYSKGVGFDKAEEMYVKHGDYESYEDWWEFYGEAMAFNLKEVIFEERMKIMIVSYINWLISLEGGEKNETISGINS